MAAFVLRREIDLSDLGKDWEGCQIVLRDLTVEEVQLYLVKIAKLDDGSQDQVTAILDVISRCFLEGRGFNGKEIVDIKREDIEKLPLSVYRKCFDFLAQSSSEKSPPSTKK